LEIKPDHYEGLVFSGVIHHEHGDDRRAEKFLKQAVALYSEAFLPNFSLGAVYAGSGELSRAVLFLERAVAADALPQALFLLGRCYYDMGKPSRSIHSLREAVRRDPAFEEAHLITCSDWPIWTGAGTARRWRVFAPRSGSIRRR